MTQNRHEPVQHKVFFFNGPPGSGKDSICNHVVSVNKRNFITTKFAHPLKAAVKELYGVSDEYINHIERSPNAQNLKNVKSDVFFSMSYREALIDLSENYFKVKHGKDVFGKNMCNRLNNLTTSCNILVSDSGFKDEAIPVIEQVGKENCFLIRLHRKGHDFSGDSRGYWNADDLGVQEFEIKNKNIHKFCLEGLQLVTNLSLTK